MASKSSPSPISGTYWIPCWCNKGFALTDLSYLAEGVQRGSEGGGGRLWRGRDRDRDLGGAFQYSRRGLRLRRRGAYGIHRASGPMDAKGCVARLHPTGKTTHYILCVAPLLHPLLSLTHWIFRSLMLPYKSSSHSANHVCCASLRSGSKETRKSAAFPMDMQGFETSTHQKLSL